MLVLVPHVTQACNDVKQVEPVVEKFQQLPEGIGAAEQFLADTGYFSEHNVGVCEKAGVKPMIATKREQHHPHWRERFTEPAPLPEGAGSVEAMKQRLKTRAGRAAYALRKQTVEPVFGIIKSVMGFRQFLLRGWRTSATNGPWFASRGI